MKAREAVSPSGPFTFREEIPMRTVRLAALLATAATLSACGEPVRPGAELQPSSGTQRDIGTYLGSGTSFDTVAVSSDDAPDATGRGSGYFGNGN